MAVSVEASGDRPLSTRLAAFARRASAAKPIRFLVVGGLNTLFGYGLFAMFYLISHLRQPSLIAATVISVLFNYFTTGRLVFANKGLRAMAPFFAGYGVVLLVNMAVLEGLTRAGVSTLPSQAIALPAMVALSYIINRYGVFRRRIRIK